MMKTKWLVCKMKRRPVQVVGVQDEEKTSTITPLDELSPRHTKRRTDALFSLLKEEAEGQITT